MTILLGVYEYTKSNWKVRPWSTRIRWLLAFLIYPAFFTALGYFIPTMSNTIPGLLCVFMPCFFCSLFGWIARSAWTKGGRYVRGVTSYHSHCKICDETMNANSAPTVMLETVMHMHQHKVDSGLA